jgi:hypothetical protein
MFVGTCARCKAQIEAEVSFSSTGDADVKPAPVIGSYCICGDKEQHGGLNGPQAVPLTLREAV